MWFISATQTPILWVVSEPILGIGILTFLQLSITELDSILLTMLPCKPKEWNNRNNQSKAVLSRWRVQGQEEEGLLPKAYMFHPANNLGSDRYVEKGDYVRLNNIKFGYQLSQEMCNRLGVRKANFTVSARKLLTFTNYSGQDPEVGQDASNPFWIGVDNAKTPPPKIVTFSIAVGF